MQIQTSPQTSLDWIDTTCTHSKERSLFHHLPETVLPSTSKKELCLTPTTDLTSTDVDAIEDLALKVLHPGVGSPFSSSFAKWLGISMYSNTIDLARLFLNTGEVAHVRKLFSQENVGSFHFTSTIPEETTLGSLSTIEEMELALKSPEIAYEVLAAIRTLRILLSFHGIAIPNDTNPFTVKDLMVEGSCMDVFSTYDRKLHLYLDGSQKTATPHHFAGDFPSMIGRAENHFKAVLAKHPEFVEKVAKYADIEAARLAKIELLSWDPEAHMPAMLSKQGILRTLGDLNRTEGLIQFLRGERTVHPGGGDSEKVIDAETAANYLSVVKQFSLDFAMTLDLIGSDAHEQLISDIEARQSNRQESLDDLLGMVADLRKFFTVQL